MQYTHKNQKHWLLSLVAGVSVVLPLAEIPQAQSQTTPTNASDDSTYLVQGKKGTKGTCHFSTRLTLAPGETAVEERQVGFDAANCILTMQSVTPDFNPGFAASARTSLASKGGTLAAPPAPTSGLIGSAALVRSTRAYSRTFLVNRNGAFQNHVKDGVSYAYNGSQVSGSCQTFSDQFKWNSTLWSLLARTTTTCLYNPSRSTITGSSGARLASPAGFFCPSRTDVYYNRHKTIGKADGTIVDNANFGGSSGCLSQLFIRHQIVRY